MTYQFIKHNKTGSRVLGRYAQPSEVKRAIAKLGLKFVELSYVGQFPVFSDGQKTYSVQGSVDMGSQSVVCSLGKEAQDYFSK